MTAFLARLRQVGSWALWLVPLAALLAGGALWTLLRRRRASRAPGELEAVASAVRGISERLSEASTRANVEVAVARAEDSAVRQQMRQILVIEDAKARRRALVALHDRLEAQVGRKP